MKSYEGNEPFLFVSYAHKDKELVYPVLESLEKRGVRFWYDQDIHHGTMWQEKIQQCLMDCGGVLAFVSESYCDSKDCRKEINFAEGRGKDLYVVRLDDAELLHGLGYTLEGIQYLLYRESADSLVDSLVDGRDMSRFMEQKREWHLFWRPGGAWFGKYLTGEQRDLIEEDEAEHFSAWGPERKVYKADEFPQQWALNSRIDVEGYGDERRFLMVREVGARQWRSEIWLEPGKRYEARIIYHVHGAPESNKTGEGIAAQLRASVHVPEQIVPQRHGCMRAAFHAEWPEESGLAPGDEVWSTAYLYAGEEPLFLQYVVASCKFENGGKLNGTVVSTSIFDEQGVLLGYNKLSGIILSGEEYSGAITFQFEARSHVGSCTVNRLASVDGGEMKPILLYAQPDDTVAFRTVFENVSDMHLRDVTFKDAVPDELMLVEGSTEFDTSVGFGKRLSDLITKNGYNFGNFGSGVSVTVDYKMKMPSPKYPSNYLTTSTVYHHGGHRKSALILHVDGTEDQDPRFVEDMKNDARYIDAYKKGKEGGWLSGWGPARDTFTMKQPARHVAFNSITDNNILGDERNFVRIRRAGHKKYGDNVQLVPGYFYEVYIWFHNNASPSLGEKCVARDVRMSVTMPEKLDAFQAGSIQGVITCPNAQPEKVWDSCYCWATEPVRLRYLDGSATLMNLNPDSRSFGLDADLFSNQGALLGFDRLDGVIGCEDGKQAGHVSFRFAVLEG